MAPRSSKLVTDFAALLVVVDEGAVEVEVEVEVDDDDEVKEVPVVVVIGTEKKDNVGWPDA